jgi:hypothetical protein
MSLESSSYERQPDDDNRDRVGVIGNTGKCACRANPGRVFLITKFEKGAIRCFTNVAKPVTSTG